jgi:hypothetical protein
MGMTIDMSDFEKGFKKLVEDSIPPDIEKGMFAAANALLKDAIYEQPYAPFDEGHLRASARVEKIRADKEAVELATGFNIAYAARWHELSPAEDARISWILPGSGRKYLESKMARNAKRYLDIVGEYLRRLLGG